MGVSSKIVISGVTSFQNRGVESLVRIALDQLRKRLPDSQFLVLERFPEYDGSKLPDPDVQVAFDESLRTIDSTTSRRLILQLSKLIPRLAPDYHDIISQIENATAVIASGGDVFCSEYGHRSLQSHLAPLCVAQRAGRPTFLLAQSIGPFKTAEDRNAFLATARRVEHITVRESLSYRYCIEDLGLSETRVSLAGDPAFLLAPTDVDWREHFGLRTGTPVVGLAMSQAISSWSGLDDEQHFNAWRGLVSHILADLRAEVILIPHVQDRDPSNDDRVLATRLQRYFGFDPRIKLAGSDFTAADFKGIIARCDLVVAERMHAAIAALSSMVPAVVVGYSCKAEGILGELLDTPTIQNTVLIPIQKFLAVEHAWERISSAWEQRGELKERLEASMPRAKAQALKSFEIIASRLSLQL